MMKYCVVDGRYVREIELEIMKNERGALPT